MVRCAAPRTRGPLRAGARLNEEHLQAGERLKAKRLQAQRGAPEDARAYRGEEKAPLRREEPRSHLVRHSGQGLGRDALNRC
jgi:hypothetical protein